MGIERLMNIWIKISSLAIVGYAFYMIHLGISFVELYNNQTYQFISLSSLIFIVLAVIFTLIFGLIFYSPFFYYAWINKPDKNWKSFARIISIIFIVSFILGLINAWGLDVTGEDAFFISLFILFLIPLYYYAWRSETTELAIPTRKQLDRLKEEIKLMKKEKADKLDIKLIEREFKRLVDLHNVEVDRRKL